SQRLELHDAESVGLAWKHEDVRRGKIAGERLVLQLAEEHGLGVTLFELIELRTAADDELRSRQVEREKGVEVLLHRHPPDRDEQRTRQIERNGAVGPEHVGVDAARPHPEVYEIPGAQLIVERG